MIKNSTPLSMVETLEYMKKIQNPKTEVKDFIKKFIKLDIKKAKELKDQIEQLEILQVNENHISKIIDFLPEDKEELNKIFPDTTLDEDETKKLLKTIKKFK